MIQEVGTFPRILNTKEQRVLASLFGEQFPKAHNPVRTKPDGSFWAEVTADQVPNIIRFWSPGLLGWRQAGCCLEQRLDRVTLSHLRSGFGIKSFQWISLKGFLLRDTRLYDEMVSGQATVYKGGIVLQPGMEYVIGGEKLSADGLREEISKGWRSRLAGCADAFVKVDPSLNHLNVDLVRFKPLVPDEDEIFPVVFDGRKRLLRREIIRPFVASQRQCALSYMD